MKPPLLLSLAALGMVALMPERSPAQSAPSDYAGAAAGARRDLEDALHRLSVQRSAIAAEKIPLAEDLQARTAEVRQHRRLAEMARKERDSRIYDLNALESRNLQAREEAAYIRNLLADYVSQFESRLHRTEAPRYAAPIASALQTEGLDPSAQLERQLSIADTAISRLEAVLAGDRFAGDALIRNGEIRTGTFALFGPVAYFLSEDGKTAGVSAPGPGLEPLVHPLGGKAANSVRAVLDGREATLPLDVTLGNALALAQTRDSLAGHFRKGGFWMYPILALGLAATAAALWKWRQLRAIQDPPDGFLASLLELLREHRTPEALAHTESLRHPARSLLLEGIRHHQEPRELLEEILYAQWLEEQPRLQRGLTLIGVTAATAPLLGLLGTVTGMITTFGLIQVLGTGDARRLSGGIYEALITTEFGLVIAIPALLLHALLSRRVQRILATTERMGVAFVNGLTAPPQDP